MIKLKVNLKNLKEKWERISNASDYSDGMDLCIMDLKDLEKELRELMLDYEPYRVPQIRIKEVLGEE